MKKKNHTTSSSTEESGVIDAFLIEGKRGREIKTEITEESKQEVTEDR